jgi:hypothetical protein
LKQVVNIDLPSSDMLAVPQPPWTYDLEIALFNALINFRPIGIHKAMRIVSITNHVNSKAGPTDHQFTVQDIKDKLNELYDMDGLEEQEETDETDEDPSQKRTEFDFPFQDVVGIVEDRGRGVEGDCSPPSSPEAVMSVRSGRSGGGRGQKRRREESSAAISNTEVGSDDEGTTWNSRPSVNWVELTSPTTTTRMKRPRTTTVQRKTSASATPAASTAPKRRGGRQTRKKEESEEEEQEEDAEEEDEEEEEAEETESIPDTASVAGTDGGPSKSLRTSSRRKGQDDVKIEASKRGAARGRAARGARARARGGRAARGRGR